MSKCVNIYIYMYIYIYIHRHTYLDMYIFWCKPKEIYLYRCKSQQDVQRIKKK